jgi:hypothetical protein
MLKATNPEKYPVDKKPPELRLLGRNNSHFGPPGQQMAGLTPGEPTMPNAGFPYNFYPPPYVQPAWYGLPSAAGPGYLQPPTGYAQPPAMPPALKQTIQYPTISTWLEYCDRHPQRSGEDFSDHAWKFDKQGYRRINQLTGERITVEKLSDWIDIGKGTADLLIRYAEEDADLVKAGTFTMELADGADSGVPGEDSI